MTQQLETLTHTENCEQSQQQTAAAHNYDLFNSAAISADYNKPSHPSLSALTPTAPLDSDLSTRSPHNMTHSSDSLHQAPQTHETPKTSIVASVSVLTATTLGAGTLALPFAMAQTGWLFGCILLIGIGYISAYAVRILIRAAIRANVESYEELGAAAYGRYGKSAVTLVTCVLVFGILTAYLVIIADTITPSVRSLFGMVDAQHIPFWGEKWFLLCLTTAVLVIPLSLLRSVHALERWTYVAVGLILLFCIVVAGMCIVALFQGQIEWSRVESFKLHTSSLFNALPIISLAYCCQPMIFPVYAALENNTYPRIRRVIHHSLLFCSLLYLLVGISAYLLYNIATNDDILNNLPASNVFCNCLRIAFTVAMLIHYPVVHYAFRQAVELAFYKQHPFSYTRHTIETIAVIVVTLLFALLFPDLGTVFGLTGALTAYWYCFILPGLFFLRVHSQSWVRRISKTEVQQDGSVMITVRDETVNSSQESQIAMTNLSAQQVDSAYDPHIISKRAVMDFDGMGMHQQKQQHNLPFSQRLPVYALLLFAAVSNVISVIVAGKTMGDSFSAKIGA